jgi:flagellar hook-associated protein 3 FlgL
MIGGTRYRLDAEIARQARLSEEIRRAQVDISSGKRLQTASDDPSAAARVSEIRRTQANEAQWATNVQNSATLATGADNALTDIGTALDRAKELMVTANTATVSEETRLAAAIELRGLADRIATVSQQTDIRGQGYFPASVLEVPVGPGMTVIPTASRATVFTVTTAAGARDLETLIRDAADALEIADPAARQTAATASLDEVNRAVSHIAIQRGSQGMRSGQLESLKTRFEESSLNLIEDRGLIEDTDIAGTYIQLQAKLTSLQFSQQVLTRLTQSGLFEMLR